MPAVDHAKEDLAATPPDEVTRTITRQLHDIRVERSSCRDYPNLKKLVTTSKISEYKLAA